MADELLERPEQEPITGSVSFGLVRDLTPPLKPIAGGLVMKRPPEAVMPLPPAPPMNDLVYGKWDWTPLGNNEAGDCVIAAAGHVIQLHAWHAKRENVDITAKECPDVYSQLSGWKRGDPTEGPGLQVRIGFGYARDVGLGGRKIASIHPSVYLPGDGAYGRDRNCLSRDNLRRRISVFGSVVIAFDCPKTATRSLGPWRARDMDPEIAGGHCIPLVAYDNEWFECTTWGRLIKIDWEFLVKYTTEVYVCYAADWMTDLGSADYRYSLAQMIDTATVDQWGEIVPIVP